MELKASMCFSPAAIDFDEEYNWNMVIVLQLACLYTNVFGNEANIAYREDIRAFYIS